jgi:hypothetical protein
MALTDNLIVKVQPASADTFVKNLIDSTDVAVNGAGTLTLQNDAGLYGWLVQGARNGTFNNGISYEGGAITAAVRFKVNSRAADFAQYLGIFTTSTGGYGIQVTNNGSTTGTLRVREAISGSGFTAIGTPSYTTGNYITLVIRLRDNGYGSGTLDLFLKQSSRSSNNPDYSVVGSTAIRTGTVDDLVLGATSQNITFTDIAVWTRDLTDAEAAGVADDIRGQLTTSSDPAAAISWTEANDTVSATVTVTNASAISWTEESDTVSISASSTAPTTTVGISWTEADDAVTAQAYVQPRAAVSWTEDNDTISSVLETTVERTGGGQGYNEGKRRYRVGNRVVEVSPAELKKIIEQETLAQEQKVEKPLKPAQITKTVEKALAPLVDLPLPDVLPVVKELKQRLLAVKEAQRLPVLKAVRKVEQQLIEKQEEDDEDEYILSLLLMD